jgi:hypothetical protein
MADRDKLREAHAQIPTWNEAMEVIVAANMASRKSAPPRRNEDRGRRDEGPRGEGNRGEGPRNEGPRNEGRRDEGRGRGGRR